MVDMLRHTRSPWVILSAVRSDGSVKLFSTMDSGWTVTLGVAVQKRQCRN